MLPNSGSRVIRSQESRVLSKSERCEDQKFDQNLGCRGPRESESAGCWPDPTNSSNESSLVDCLGEIHVHFHDKCSQSEDIVHFEAFVSAIVCMVPQWLSS